MFFFFFFENRGWEGWISWNRWRLWLSRFDSCLQENLFTGLTTHANEGVICGYALRSESSSACGRTPGGLFNIRTSFPQPPSPMSQKPLQEVDRKANSRSAGHLQWPCSCRMRPGGADRVAPSLESCVPASWGQVYRGSSSVRLAVMTLQLHHDLCVSVRWRWSLVSVVTVCQLLLFCISDWRRLF